ncbi:MAG: aspartate aminotransferase family protein [Actinomycetia bacterium]|nr:aspartate aminotransferase family protein [Actinomycetes bacterium]MCP3913373.1 aspartate aminotransferase family protein [Actinomycetes bacterium]MCP4084502.1 aspartate aminotransferase family protein [Actinomycetes bacterium]
MFPDPQSRSAHLYQRARKVLPDGVSRSTVLVRPHPIYVAEGEGAWITDVDGHRLLDCNNNFTAILLGHANPVINDAVTAQLAAGSAFSLATEAEIELAETLCDRVPSFDRVRFCNSGTEAVMGAIKAARAFTGRPMIAKVEGSYHGTYDHAETSLGPGTDEWGDADSPASVPYAAGAPASVAAETAILPYNNPSAARSIIDRCAGDLAAVLIDTLPSRVGFPQPDPAFLDAVVSTAESVGALVILDEVITFRLGIAGNQGRLAMNPDLTALAKIIGGGFPVGAVAGRAEVMGVFESPDGDTRPAVPSGGTFSANSVTMVAGQACLTQLTDASFARLADLGVRARHGLERVFVDAGVKWQVTGEGSLFRIHPHQRTVLSYRDAAHSPSEATRMAHLQHQLINRGVWYSGYGMGCLSLAMDEADIDHLVGAVADSLAEVGG